MPPRPAIFAFALTLVTACWFVVRPQQVRAQQQAPAPAYRIPVDPSDVTAIAQAIELRSEHLTPLLDGVHAADWAAKGAPEVYVAQWNSLSEQNRAIQSDMAGIAQRPDAMQNVMSALFRVHRFDSDLDRLLEGIRRYQNPALADLIESVAAGDQNGVEKLQQYVLDLANEKERRLDVEDQEAQRCRAQLANQPRTPAIQTKTGSPK